MKLNAFERAAMNNPVRAAHQHHREAAWFRRLSGGGLSGQQVLEVGCGRGVGAEVILDRLGAAWVAAFDLDESMVELAQRRLHGRPVQLSVGDVCEIAQPTASVDAVVDFGIIHHVPDWQQAVAEIARVLRPGGLVLFEEVPREMLDTWAFRTFTVHPHENRFQPGDFADELARNGLHGSGEIERHLGGMVFVGAVRKTEPAP
ncbi:Methyltransferase domain protein [uncultured Mycobacterium sp.]|uniref:Methyltransferase type 11 n=2 Tax=Mycobacteriaceae TaxID=1762 RepID=A0A064C8Z4_9MYCO|nr:class I SAM-dependent methyltransferase [Mycolicibacterium aromaticivorans]KDE97119.1 methyltransferase type 11 [Mycolicibacterium aromaticivorans JS19b1 = JCM 16368]SBS77503.1 Methyltransferase domain protein [uncultured Mycobacterium sp.]